MMHSTLARMPSVIHRGVHGFHIVNAITGDIVSRRLTAHRGDETIFLHWAGIIVILALVVFIGLSKTLTELRLCRDRDFGG